MFAIYLYSSFIPPVKRLNCRPLPAYHSLKTMKYDALFLGNYTRDTIVSPEATRTVDGGAFYYGANVACRLGLRTTAVTRLAREHFAVLEELLGLGVSVRAEATPRSTVLRLEYPDADPDHRRILVQSSAGSFQPHQVADLQARVACIGASFRGRRSC